MQIIFNRQQQHRLYHGFAILLFLLLVQACAMMILQHSDQGEGAAIMRRRRSNRPEARELQQPKKQQPKKQDVVPYLFPDGVQHDHHLRVAKPTKKDPHNQPHKTFDDMIQQQSIPDTGFSSELITTLKKTDKNNNNNSSTREAANTTLVVAAVVLASTLLIALLVCMVRTCVRDYIPLVVDSSRDDPIAIWGNEDLGLMMWPSPYDREGTTAVTEGRRTAAADVGLGFGDALPHHRPTPVSK